MLLEQSTFGCIGWQCVLAMPTLAVDPQVHCDCPPSGWRLLAQSPEQFQNEIAQIEKYLPLPTKASLRQRVFILFQTGMSGVGPEHLHCRVTTVSCLHGVKRYAVLFQTGMSGILLPPLVLGLTHHSACMGALYCLAPLRFRPYTPPQEKDGCALPAPFFTLPPEYPEKSEKKIANSGKGQYSDSRRAYALPVKQLIKGSR